MADRQSFYYDYKIDSAQAEKSRFHHLGALVYSVGKTFNILNVFFRAKFFADLED